MNWIYIFWICYLCRWYFHGCLMRFMRWQNSKMLLIYWLRSRIGLHYMTLICWIITRFVTFDVVVSQSLWIVIGCKIFQWRSQLSNSPKCDYYIIVISNTGSSNRYFVNEWENRFLHFTGLWLVLYQIISFHADRCLLQQLFIMMICLSTSR